jgi:thioredoxin 1
MSFSTPIHTNEQSIERVLNTGLPSILVFWRKDCPPCEQLNPVLDRLARLYAGKALFAKVDSTDNAGLVRRYNVEQLPTLIVVQNGRVLGRTTGAASETSLRSWLDGLLAHDGRVTPPNGPSIALHRVASSQPRSPSQPVRSEPSGVVPMVLTDASFDQVIANSAQPVLVDFWAPWCGPCRMLAPSVEQLAREFSGQAIVGKLNVDDNPRIADRYRIQSIPAIYVFHHGQIVERLVGVQPAAVLRQALQKRLAKTHA